MLNNVCRVCGRQKICEKSLNLFDLVNRRFLKHLHMITGLRLCPMENVPGFMCLCCQAELRSALAFRKLCVKTQKKWLTIEEDSSSDEESSNAKTKLESEKCASLSIFGEPDECEELEETFQILIKEEPLDNVLIRDPEDLEELKSVSHCNTNKEILETSVPRQKILRSISKPKTDDHIYICELCGTHATSKSNFQRHMRKHTGERPFGCKECDARFLAAAELRAHLRVHSKEQPFACRYCEKRYVSYMGRMVHERTHTNERPYVCEECGKKFTTAYVLKNHMLIHTGERLFRCELCDRAFQRKAHLITHFRSMMHQLNQKNQQSLLILGG
ncbi:transcription factor Ouib [Drosophila biarmipes]|uniref:transcription factor Ouib n=1 Tax=Drosophila biarmipes TaxID=125945 RepID=UPI0007E766BD|nr:transcription factor Ouib [Drosophila biarmipes]